MGTRIIPAAQVGTRALVGQGGPEGFSEQVRELR